MPVTMYLKRYKIQNEIIHQLIDSMHERQCYCHEGGDQRDAG